MLFKTCTYYLLESLVQVFKKDSFKSASWQNLSEFWRLLCLFSAANPSNKSLSFKKRTIQNMGGKLSFFENTPSLSFTLNYLFDKIILDLFLMNDTILLLITLILYFIIMMQNYLHLHYPIWKKKTQNSFKIQHTNTLLHFQRQ